MSYGRYDICTVFRVARHAEPCICHNDHKTYTWNDIILYKRSMIRVFSCSSTPDTTDFPKEKVNAVSAPTTPGNILCAAYFTVCGVFVNICVLFLHQSLH